MRQCKLNPIREDFSHPGGNVKTCCDRAAFYIFEKGGGIRGRCRFGVFDSHLLRWDRSARRRVRDAHEHGAEKLDRPLYRVAREAGIRQADSAILERFRGKSGDREAPPRAPREDG